MNQNLADPANVGAYFLADFSRRDAFGTLISQIFGNWAAKLCNAARR
jgi:hypothetical protein